MKNAQSTQSGARRTLSGALFCSLLLTTSLLAGCQIAPSNAPKLLAPLDQLRLEWADVYQEREKGLMGRTSLPENAGMLFVFETPKTYCFWMKNTLLPLTAAFVVATGTLGSLFGLWGLDVLRIRDPFARGLTMGTISHAQGTAVALQEGEEQGAMGGLAMILAGILTAALAPAAVYIVMRLPLLQ